VRDVAGGYGLAGFDIPGQEFGGERDRILAQFVQVFGAEGG
jgi:hypothetical protein